MRNSFIPVILSMLTFFPANCLAEDWPRWRGPHDDGRSRETDWLLPAGDPPKLIRWRCSVGVGFASLVIANEKAYTVGHVDGQDVVSCINLADGSFTWRFAYEAPLDDRDFEGGPTSTPTLDQDRLFVLSREGDLFCLDAASGQQIWRRNIIDETGVRSPGWGFSAAPLVVGDRLIINAGESGIALDKGSGELLWKSGDRECGYATPVVIPGTQGAELVIASGKAFVGVGISDGAVRWTERWLTSFNCNAADPIIKDDRMFLSSGYNRGSAMFDLSGEAPEVVWKSKEMKNQIHSSILFEGHLYGIDGDMDTDAQLRCMDWQTGAILWSADDLRPGGITIAGDRLIVLTQSGELVVAEATPSEFAPTARAKVLDGKCWAAPVLADSMIYCRSIDGQVVCVDCRK